MHGSWSSPASGSLPAMEREPQVAEPSWESTPFEVVIGDYLLLVLPNGRPGFYDHYRQHAQFVDELDLDTAAGRIAFVAVRQAEAAWPFLVVRQRYTAHAVASDCGAVLLPETRRLFLAAGERLLAYDLTPEQPRRLWQDTAELGFWSWRVHQGVVLMAAELELAAWDSQARKLWSTFVEPPWDYRLDDDTVVLDVMGRTSRFPLRTGPPSRQSA